MAVTRVLAFPLVGALLAGVLGVVPAEAAAKRAPVGTADVVSTRYATPVRFRPAANDRGQGSRIVPGTLRIAPSSAHPRGLKVGRDRYGSLWRVNTRTGAVTVTPSKNYHSASSSTLTYTVKDRRGRRSAPIPVTVNVAANPCGYNAPASYVPPAGTAFNFPFGSQRQRQTIRWMMLNTVRSVPRCQAILIASYSLDDWPMARALAAAAKRGVSVRMVLDGHVRTGGISASYRWLRKRLGTSPSATSYARICKGSCRGTGGTSHYKLFLVSGMGRGAGPEVKQKWVVLTGSPNMTGRAAWGQWNHLDVMAGEKTWQRYAQMFYSMVPDRPVPSPYRMFTDIYPTTWFFPKYGNTPATDPLVQGLSTVRCGGATNTANGRTVVRIGQYAWFGYRGEAIARLVRAMWVAGCDVKIEYAIVGGSVKRILRAKARRGPIPMRQVATFASDGEMKAYDHAKWIVVVGHVGKKTDATFTWTGTTNFTDLSLASDDFTQLWGDRPRALAYLDNFNRIWRSKHAKKP